MPQKEEAKQANPTVDKLFQDLTASSEWFKQRQSFYWRDIFGDGLLMAKMQIFVDNVDLGTPNYSDMVSIKYKCRLESGKVVEQFDRMVFILGHKEVASALDSVVPLMYIGQKVEIVAAAKYCYGKRGNPKNDIPANSKLFYDVELMAKEKLPNIKIIPSCVRFEIAEKKRLRGNDLVQMRDYDGAILCYTKALEFLEPSFGSQGWKVEEQVKDNSIKCLNNLAACQLKLKVFDKAKEACLKVLSMDGKNTNATYRLSNAYLGIKDIPKAIVYMEKAVNLDPTSKAYKEELDQLYKQVSPEKEVKKIERMLEAPENVHGSPKLDTIIETESPEPDNIAETDPPKENATSWLGWAAGAAVVAAGCFAAYRYFKH